jgi:exodeoxyribonuclease V beta subunit
MTSSEANAWDELALDRHGFIEASAGTGKTFTIENLVVRILTEPSGNPWKRWIDLDEVLIVTYTEKATEELRFRIRRTLEEKLHAPSAAEKLPGDAARHIERCLTRFDRACMYTFHGFCNRFLTAHAFESQSSFGEEQADPAELALRSVREIIRGTLVAGAWADCEKMRLSLEKWRIKDVDDFCGKVSSVIRHYGGDGQGRDALRPGPQAEKIVLLYNDVRRTFCTRDPDGHPFALSWGRIKAALKLRADPKKKGETLKTLLCLPQLDTAEQMLAFFRQEPLACAMVRKDPAEFFLPVASKASESYRSPRQVAAVIDGHNGRSFSEYMNTLSALHAALQEHDAAQDLEGLFSIIKEAHAGFLLLKRQNGMRTFDDMIRGMHDVLAGNNDSMLSVLRSRFRYGIIDEFQDTNAQQWDIFRRIFVDDGDRRPVSRKSCLYVVGDPKQSVFSFQGSDVAVYQSALAELKRDGAADVPLRTNYRGTQAMMAACNRLFIDNQDNPAGGGWFLSDESGIRYSEVASWGRVRDADCAPGVPKELRTPMVFKALYSVNESGLETRKKADKERDLARWICSTIDYLLRPENGRTPLRIPDDTEHKAVSTITYRNLEPNDICILVEKHREAGPLMKLFRERGISYTKQRNTGLFVSDECLHLLAMLDAVDRSADGVATKKALLTKFFGFSPADLGETPDLYDDAWKDQVELMRRFSVMAGRRQWGMLFGELFKTTALLDGLAQDVDRKLRVAALRQLRSYCLRCLIERKMGLTELVARLRSLYKEEITEEEDETIFQKETEGNAVRILTMHSAKGLEFPLVFIAGGKGAGGTSTDYYAVHNPAGGTDFWFGECRQGKDLFERMRRRETRRLYYVALTRAKYRLFAPVWDLYDPAAGSIVRRGRRSDASSASALFLSRAFGRVAVAGTGNDDLFSFVAQTRAAPEAGAARLSRGGTNVSAVALGAESPAPPANRMTIQHSYSGMVRLAQKLGVRLNPGADEPHDSDEATWGKKNEILEPGAATGNALHDILEQADFGRWAGAPAVQDLLTLGSPSALLVDKSLSNRGLFTGTRKDAHIRVAAAALVQSSLCAVFPDPAGAERPSIMLGGLAAAQRRPEAEFHFTFAKDRTPFPEAGRAIGGWVLGFIDLLFRIGARYYLVDWKSNWMPDNDYGVDAIRENMERHHYDVQYKVYSLALHHWLSRRIPSYDPEINFGGLVYVYLRGTAPGTARGIWTIRPTHAELRDEWPLFVKDRLREAGGAAS